MNFRFLIVLAILSGLAVAFLALNMGEMQVGSFHPDLRWVSWIIFLLGYAVCSGANVAYFALSRRDLKKIIWRGEQAEDNTREARQAIKAKAVLSHLRDPNWTLASILLTNVGFGVYLSQLSDTLFAGI